MLYSHPLWELNKSCLYHIHVNVWHTANVQWMIAIEFKMSRTVGNLKGVKQKFPSKVYSYKNRKLKSRQIMT